MNRPPAPETSPDLIMVPREAGPDWRLAQPGKLCAQKRGRSTCRRPAVLEFNRRQHRFKPRHGLTMDKRVLPWMKGWKT